MNNQEQSLAIRGRSNGYRGRLQKKDTNSPPENKYSHSNHRPTNGGKEVTENQSEKTQKKRIQDESENVSSNYTRPGDLKSPQEQTEYSFDDGRPGCSKKYQHKGNKASKSTFQQTNTNELQLSFCHYCGDEWSSGQDVCIEGHKVYHEECFRVHLPRSKEAIEGFLKCVPSNQKVLSIGINVKYLYGVNKEHPKSRNAKRKKRENKIQELLKCVTALRNSNSGHLLIHLVGLSKGDNYTGAFHEFADEKLNGLINDGKLFTDVYKKENLSKRLAGFSDFLVLYVAGASCLTTSDYRTKVALDEGIIDPSPLNICTFLEEKKEFDTQFHKLDNVEVSEDLQDVQEDRSIQLKGNYLGESDAEEVVAHMFLNLKLAEYISAFAKLEDGGSYLFGVKQESVRRGHYRSQTNGIQPIPREDAKRITELIDQQIWKTLLVCDYDGNEQDAGIVQVNFIPSEQNIEDVVLHLSVRSVSGLVFYDKSGPLAYRYDETTDSVGRFTVKDWFLKVLERK